MEINMFKKEFKCLFDINMDYQPTPNLNAGVV